MSVTFYWIMGLSTLLPYNNNTHIFLMIKKISKIATVPLKSRWVATLIIHLIPVYKFIPKYQFKKKNKSALIDPIALYEHKTMT